jgi:hypothetical protein
VGGYAESVVEWEEECQAEDCVVEHSCMNPADNVEANERFELR